MRDALRPAAVIALAALLAATPALAGPDRVFARHRASLLTQDYVGQPLWTLLAGCAGSHGAAYAYFTERSRAAEADSAKAAGTQLLNRAVDRLVIDRRIERKAALGLTLSAVEAGRTGGAAALAAPGQDESMRWLGLRTSCEEIAAAAG